jgi:hypothetical protein
MLFEKEYSFRGTHAATVLRLTAIFDSISKAKLFQTNVDIYILAPIIGFLFQRKAPLDKSTAETTKIFPNELSKYKEELEYSYRLIMLLDKKNESNIDRRIDKAFRIMGTPEAANDELLFEEYVRGGIEVLSEKLILVGQDYVMNMYDFLTEMEDRRAAETSIDAIEDLCRLARK